MSIFKLSPRDIAFTAVFAALSVIVCKVIPGIPIIGGSGSIKFDAALAPIYGLVTGPFLGAFAALVGGLVAAGGYLSILTSFCTAISAFVAGILTHSNYVVGGVKIKGWSVGSLVILLLVLGWYFTWVGQQAPLYPILQLVGLLITLFFRGRLSNYFERGIGWKLGVAVCLASYCGIIADHMLGNLIYIANFPTLNWPPIFMMVLPISTIERTLLTIIATFIGFSLILSLRRAGLFTREFQAKSTPSTSR